VEQTLYFDIILRSYGNQQFGSNAVKTRERWNDFDNISFSKIFARPPYLFYDLYVRVSEVSFRKSSAKVLTNVAVLFQLNFTLFYLEIVLTQKF
jgi:hypothetical protein